jgi:hypothetical protein
MNYALIVKTHKSCHAKHDTEAVKDFVSIAAKVYQPPATVDPQVPFFYVRTL